MAVHNFELTYEIEYDDTTDIVKFTTTNSFNSPNECTRKASRNNLKSVKKFMGESNHEAIDCWLREQGLLND